MSTTKIRSSCWNWLAIAVTDRMLNLSVGIRHWLDEHNPPRL